MKTKTFRPGAAAGFTLIEVMISMTIVVSVLGMALSTFMFCLKTMYLDMERLKTNASLRSFTAQITQETVDASTFLVFPLYTSLDGNVNLVTDPSTFVLDTYGTQLAFGDCLVLVTLVDESSTGNSNIRSFCIYYRAVTDTNHDGRIDSNDDGPIYYWQSKDYGANGTAQTLTQLLNTVNLNSTPVYPGARMLTKIARGKKKPVAQWISPTVPTYYPIFCTESPLNVPTTENVSINVEFINGTDVNHLLSSSSFNYTISPRR